MALNYGTKYDPPVKAMSLPVRTVSAIVTPRRHELVGYSKRGYGAYVERVRYQNSGDKAYDTTITSRLYQYDEQAETELKALVAELEAARALHLAPIQERIQAVIARLVPITKPERS